MNAAARTFGSRAFGLRFSVVLTALAALRMLHFAAYLLVSEPLIRATLPPLFRAEALVGMDLLSMLTGLFDRPLAFHSTLGWLTANLAVLLALALLGAGIWSLLDRGAFSERARARLQTILRYALAVLLMQYGAQKVFPNQFGGIAPNDLIKPLGDVSTFRLLWLSMAASPGYTMFTGAVEVLAALLLFSRRTTAAGALLSVAAMTNVVALNLAYDISAVIYAALMLVLRLLLISPFVPTLAGLLLMGRAARPLPGLMA